MMLDVKRGLMFLCMVLLTCSAPVQQDQKESSSSDESQVILSSTGGTSQNSGTETKEIIITSPSGFGRADKNGQRTITFSVRDESSQVSVDLMRLIFTSQAEKVQSSQAGSNENKNNTETVSEETQEVHEATPGPGESTNREVLDSADSESEEIPAKIQADLLIIPSTEENKQSKERQTSFTHPDLSISQETLDKPKNQINSPVLHNLSRRPVSAPAHLQTVFSNEDSSSAETYSKGTDPQLDTSKGLAGHLHFKTTPGSATAPPLWSSSEEKPPQVLVTDLKSKDPISGPEVLVHPVEEKNQVSPKTIFSGSDLYPAYVNDEWQEVDFGHYSFGYYDPYGYQNGYGVGYDPDQYDPRHYDPNHYDPRIYDPNNYDPQHYDPYNYDPYNHDPKNYDSNHHDPYNYDPRHYDSDHYDPHSNDPNSHYYTKTNRVDPYQETEIEDPGYDSVPSSSEAVEHPTYPTPSPTPEDDSQSDEQPHSSSISPLLTPATPEEASETLGSPTAEVPSNSSSVENSQEMRPQHLVSSKETLEVTNSTITGRQENMRIKEFESKEMEVSSSSEESLNHQSKNLINQQDQTDDVKFSYDVKEVPAFSSEEDSDSPTRNTELQVRSESSTLGFDGESRREDTTVEFDLTPSGSLVSEKNQQEESDSNESTNNDHEIDYEPTLSQVSRSLESTTEGPAFDSESETVNDSLVSDEDDSDEMKTSSPSASSQVKTTEADCANQIVTPSPVSVEAHPPRGPQNTAKDKMNRIHLAPPPTNPWMAFLQALHTAVVNQVDRPVDRKTWKQQNTRKRLPQRGFKKQRVISSEEE